MLNLARMTGNATKKVTPSRKSGTTCPTSKKYLTCLDLWARCRLAGTHSDRRAAHKWLGVRGTKRRAHHSGKAIVERLTMPHPPSVLPCSAALSSTHRPLRTRYIFKLNFCAAPALGLHWTDALRRPQLYPMQPHYPRRRRCLLITPTSFPSSRGICKSLAQRLP